jgi:hypothetical protein
LKINFDKNEVVVIRVVAREKRRIANMIKSATQR